ncbi:alpha-amylase family glycosyl hydrolase [Sphingomonas sp. AR_OL41]|uniref:alpha-amylase family glycosyl hydrolase n=1 Tax=Sphingomonas sp. AR_OL41 TaxID=3042729 RepID=UPI0024817798|nr:alpha-amylase family glycosyl hydrolase [Sphingomonas sp. AR_OL41]MDH7972352.1 alpha-amylase family glycosyl hydrolase [Sphingomonas sp. AR_OL41]
MNMIEDFPEAMNLESDRARHRLAASLERIYHDAAPALFARVCASLDRASAQRDAALKALDHARRADPNWTARSGETVYACYVDRFAGTLDGVTGKLDYLQDFGIRWLHPLPLLAARPVESDGGFAVVDYRAVEPALGDMGGLERLATELRTRGMGLMLDVVCNHTAREHDWAERARQGDPKYRAYYHVVDSQAEVDAWDASLIEVFPDTAPGNFTYDAAMGSWVWTTFYPFQWDLNYANPDVFVEMLEVLLFLANKGVQGFRLDSAPFLWKRQGTTCRNQPEAYAIVAAFRAALDIAAPSVVLLTEAIESPAHVIPFFGDDLKGCDLAYNNGVMTALWAGLADQHAGIVRTMLTAAAQRPDHAAWLNYVRCHDDLIWNALADYAPVDDLQRWSSFYDGGGFSAGRRFQTAAGGVPSTNGMAAALVGLGRSDIDQDLALARLTALYGAIHALDGWPMIYMGDEIALGNDQDYRSDPARRDEGRWLQRPSMDWHRASLGPAGKMLESMCRFGDAARALNELNVTGRATPIALSNDAVLAFVRDEGRGFLCLVNLASIAQTVDRPATWDRPGKDLLTGRDVPTGTVTLRPYEILWWVAP